MRDTPTTDLRFEEDTTMTKAERIFYDTFCECKRYIRDWGYKENPDGSAVGYNTVIYGDNETVCTRTMNDIEKCIERMRKHYNQSLKFGVLDDDRYMLNIQALNMVHATVRNNRESIKRFEEMMKA